MTEPVNFFDRALAAADKLDVAIKTDHVKGQADLVTSALREALAILRGVRAENETLKKRVREPEAIDLSALETRDLLDEVSRRLLAVNDAAVRASSF